jgi:hypothetical protein
MAKKEQELTILHLTCALAHAEGFMKAVRQALESLQDTGAIKFPSSGASDALTDPSVLGVRPRGCSVDIFRPPWCPPPFEEP